MNFTETIQKKPPACPHLPVKDQVSNTVNRVPLFRHEVSNNINIVLNKGVTNRRESVCVREREREREEDQQSSARATD